MKGVYELKKILHRTTSHLYDNSNITPQTLKKLRNQPMNRFNI